MLRKNGKKGARVKKVAVGYALAKLSDIEKNGSAQKRGQSKI